MSTGVETSSGLGPYLSKDPVMIEAYESPDPYMFFAILGGHAPEGADKHSHPQVREIFKTLFLALMYGQGSADIAERLDISIFRARSLVKLH